MVIFLFCCDIFNLNLAFVKGAIWQHRVTESFLLLTDHAQSRLGKFLRVSLVRDSPAAWGAQLPGGKMVRPCRLVRSYVKCHWVISFKELTSEGFWERREKLPYWQGRGAYFFFCFPVVLAAFWSVNALSARGWSETWHRSPSTSWWSWSCRKYPQCGTWQVRVYCLLCASPSRQSQY